MAAGLLSNDTFGTVLLHGYAQKVLSCRRLHPLGHNAQNTRVARPVREVGRRVGARALFSVPSA